MTNFQQRATDLYKEVSRIPMSAKGHIFHAEKDLYQVEISWKQVDIDRGRRVKICKTYTIQCSTNDSNLYILSKNTFQSGNVNSVLETYSTDNRIKATLVRDTAKKEIELQQFIEIWNSNGLIKSFNVKEHFSKKHGDINEDEHFGSFHLSYDGTKLLYIAEKKPVNGTSFFKRTEKDEVKGAEYKFQQSWGEQLANVINPLVVVLDIDSEECTVIDCNDDVSCGGAQWVPNSSNQLVFVGYNNNPLKYGFLYHFNVRSRLYVADLQQNSCKPLTDDSKYIVCLRFNPQATKLIFMECDSYPIARIKMIDWTTKQITTVVDIVSTPKDDGFTGLYPFDMHSKIFPQKCWNTNGTIAICKNIQKSLCHVISIDTTCGAVNIMTTNTDPGTYRVLDVQNDLLLGQYTSPCLPSKIFIVKLPSNSIDKFKQEDFLEITNSKLSFGDKMKWRILDLDRGEGSLPYQAIFVSPVTSLSPPPLIVYPHGGPLLSYKAQYIQWNACFVALGYSILIVNYNGSKGFGQDFMENLTGKVGTMDVLDVQFAAEAVVKSGEACKKYHFLYGGSYVGSIGIHLATQYLDFYKALYLRNPIFNIAALRHVSDVPEWSYSVIDVPFNPAEIITTNVYSKMLDISPVANIHKINASVLLAIGMNDCRCPFSQSKELYYMMKSYGKNVKILYYPEGHPLSSIVNDGDRFINCALWFHNAIS